MRASGEVATISAMNALASVRLAGAGAPGNHDDHAGLIALPNGQSLGPCHRIRGYIVVECG